MTVPVPTGNSPAARLSRLLAAPGLTVMPCCFDALSAKMIEQAGFPLTFMSGFAVSSARLGMPDTGLISYGEMLDQGRNICQRVSIPVIGDGDTGYGNALNVVMIEDQIAPKRCGHTKGKAVVGRDEALQRIRAAVDAREELKAEGAGDILILARTDAREDHGLDEGLERARLFKEAGADILFVEALKSEEEMRTFCSSLPGPKMANLVEQGHTPLLPPEVLEDIGYQIAAYPLTIMNAAMTAMRDALAAMKEGRHPQELMDFAELRRIVGFDDYYAEEERYAGR
jgi:2-methylisocitrate lyase-like PEP mutase family enzyme